MSEYEVKWNSGRLFFPSRNDAMNFAKTNFFESLTVKESGTEKVVYEVRNWKEVEK
jgi:hypothetical protein